MSAGTIEGLDPGPYAQNQWAMPQNTYMYIHHGTRIYLNQKEIQSCPYNHNLKKILK